MQAMVASWKDFFLETTDTIHQVQVTTNTFLLRPSANKQGSRQ